MTLTNKTTYELSESESKAVLEAVKSGKKYALIQGDYIMLNAIVAIQDESKLEEMNHLRAGDYKCVFDKWHIRGDRCFGHDPVISELEPGFMKLNSDNIRDNWTPEERYSAERSKVEEVREILKKKGVLKK